MLLPIFFTGILVSVYGQQTFSTCSNNGGYNSGSCIGPICNTGYSSSQFSNIRTVDRGQNALYTLQPLYFTHTGDSDRFGEADSECATITLLPDNNQTLLVYQTIVNLDGSSRVHSYVTEVLSPGVYSQGSYDRIRTFYDIGTVGCTIVGFNVPNCGGSGGASEFYTFGLTPEYKRISQSDLQGAIAVASAQNLPLSSAGAIYVFPMNYPPQCYTPTSCLAQPPPFSQYTGQNTGFYGGYAPNPNTYYGGYCSLLN